MSLATPSCVQKLQTASHASLLNSEGVCLFREPDAGNLPVRFDEREQEIEPSQTGLRRALRKHPNSHREAKATAPVLDSTLHLTAFEELSVDDREQHLYSNVGSVKVLRSVPHAIRRAHRNLQRFPFRQQEPRQRIA